MPIWPKKKERPGVDNYGRSPVWKHAASGDLEGLRAALQDSADPTASDDAGFTALHVAAQNGHAAVAALLVAAGADVNHADKHGNGPLWTAVFQACLTKATAANMSIVQLLVHAGADPDARNVHGRSPRDSATRSQAVAELLTNS